MKRFLPVFCVAALLATMASAQELGDVSRDAMKKLSWMTGKWKGEGTFVLGPGNTISATIEEEITPKLGAMVFVVEGLGKDKSKPDRIVHNAFAVISFDPIAKKYTMRPYLANGQSIDARIDVLDDKVVWGFEVPSLGEIRYTVTKGDKGEWIEVGEMTRDRGATWFKFLDMKLQKV